MTDLIKIVRASSSMPIFMPPTYYREHYYVDGCLGGGIALDIPKKMGSSVFLLYLRVPKVTEKAA
jgi:predicted patatin/cPLA2 family phospholipase